MKTGGAAVHLYGNSHSCRVQLEMLDEIFCYSEANDAKGASVLEAEWKSTHQSFILNDTLPFECNTLYIFV